MKSITLDVDKINLTDERFRISYYFSLEKLLVSIKKIGLLQLPLVISQGKKFVLVSGWKRVLACLELSLSPLKAFVVSKKNELETFLLAFYENLASREFSLVEKSEILKKLLQFGEKREAIIKHYFPLLNIPLTTSHFDLCLALSQFEPELKKFIDEKDLPFSSVQMLSQFSPHGRRLVFPILLPLSQNKQKEILGDLLEISRKNELTVEEILMTPQIQEILGSPKFSSLQKSEKVRLSLKKKRYPSLSAWRESFDFSLKEIHWPREIAVKPTPYFEDDKLFLTFNFRNKEEFETRLSELQKIAKKEKFSRLFR